MNPENLLSIGFTQDAESKNIFHRNGRTIDLAALAIQSPQVVDLSLEDVRDEIRRKLGK